MGETTKNGQEIFKFDFSEYRKDRTKPRTATVRLEKFGPDSITVEWPVKQLGAESTYRMREEEARRANFEKLSLAVSAGTISDENIISAIEKYFSGMKDIPAELLKCFVAFEDGYNGDGEKPERSDTVRFSRDFPIEFQKITNKIFELTGMGAVGKKKPMRCFKPIQTTVE